jgi:hypothetical protein
LLKIYEIGKEQGLNYIALEYIDGKTDASLPGGGAARAAQGAALVPVCAEGLAKAHAAGIVHRD